MAKCGFEHYYVDTFKVARKDLGAGVYGVAMDFGGSLLKVAYILRSQRNEDPVTINLISFPTPNLDDALKFIKTTVLDPIKGAKDPEFFALGTGTGAMMNGPKITNTLGIKLSDAVEFDCFAKGIHYLITNKSESELVSYSGYVCPRQFGEKPPPVDQLFGLTLMNIKTNAGEAQYKASPPPLFPCIICFAGSAFAMTKVHEDGSFEAMMPLNRGGMYFYGLGRLLTGCKNFDELLKLGLAGDASGTSMTVKDFPADALKQGDMDFSTVLNDEMFTNVGLPFSKIIMDNIKNPKKEDVANTLLHSVCSELVLNCINTARRKGCQRVYLCGSFIKNNTLVREYVKRVELHEMGLNEPLLAIHALNHESYIGAIGSVIKAAADLKKK